jgi:predicted ArsR family transcriptional regulator
MPDLRRITDARTLRALSHPVRIALIEALTVGGAMTATEVGEEIGETSTTCSFHLRQLAKYGLVEEAGGGKGRARPWRLASTGMSIGANADDPESEIAASALARLFRDRAFARYQAWQDTKSAYPREWREAADDSSYLLYLTVEELAELSAEMSEMLLRRFHDRISDPSTRPEGSVPIELLVMSYPVEPPEQRK